MRVGGSSAPGLTLRQIEFGIVSQQRTESDEGGEETDEEQVQSQCSNDDVYLREKTDESDRGSGRDDLVFGFHIIHLRQCVKGFS